MCFAGWWFTLCLSPRDPITLSEHDLGCTITSSAKYLGSITLQYPSQKVIEKSGDHQLRLVVYPFICKVFYIQTVVGLGNSEPSTVSWASEPPPFVISPVKNHAEKNGVSASSTNSQVVSPFPKDHTVCPIRNGFPLNSQLRGDGMFRPSILLWRGLDS